MSIAIKLNKYLNTFFKLDLKNADKELYKSIEEEFSRQQNHIELIASENIVSKAVLEAQGSVLTNKYAEGYPGKRYYGGCEYVDVSENLAIERAKKLFDCKFANVQPHSGAQANGAVYLALLKPGDTTLAMSLNSGGHLTHGAKPAQSGKWFNALHYEVDKNTGLIDYESIEKLAIENKAVFVPFQSMFDEAVKYAEPKHWAGDGVHPSPHGASLMAHFWLQAIQSLPE